MLKVQILILYHDRVEVYVNDGKHDATVYWEIDDLIRLNSQLHSRHIIVNPNGYLSINRE